MQLLDELVDAYLDNNFEHPYFWIYILDKLFWIWMSRIQGNRELIGMMGKTMNVTSTFPRLIRTRRKLRETARDLELKESFTAYVSWRKGPKRPLRFTKSGDIHSERRYSTHYVKPRKAEQVKHNHVAEGFSNQPQGCDEIESK
jgi:hypothetical protein